MSKGEISKQIDVAFDNEPPDNYRSSRLGASIMGNPCEAYLAFCLRGFPDLKHSPKLKRIFREGHRIEKTVLADLRKANYTVYDVDPMTGKQYMWDKHNGYMVFYADGIIERSGDLMLLEIKSMNDAMWKKFKSKGLKISHKKYFDQLQIGMGYSGYRQAVLVAYNKNTSEYWDEVITFDDVSYHGLLFKGERVLMGMATKVATDQSDWRCKDCSKCGVCWLNQPVPQDMKTCANAYPTAGGWACSKGCTTTCQQWQRYEPLART